MGKYYGCDYCIFNKNGGYILVTDDITSIDWNCELHLGKKVSEAWEKSND